MTSHSNSRKISFGAAKLSRDIATLLNNRKGSDIRFKVGGGISTQGNNDNSTTVTLYAHSLILRCRSSYFAAMLDEERNWKESSNGVIYKPNISPTTFQDVLYYLYTGNVRASENIVELIAAADEMNLEELSTECQNELIRTVKCIFSDEDECIPINVAIRTHIIPALNLANTHSLSNISQELLTIILPHMPVLIKSPDAYTTFINGISLESLIKIISSDDLVMRERSVWDLAIDWACCRTKLSKTAIEARLNNLDNDEDDMESSNGVMINDSQLKRFKKTLIPLLPAIRLSLLDPSDYNHILNTLVYVLPRCRLLEIIQYFLNPGDARFLDAPRKISAKQKIHSRVVIGPKIVFKPKVVVEPKIIFESKIIVETTAWELLRKNIFEAGGITGCRSLNDLKFKLLFRASEHEYRASVFHQRCDNKGPTLVIVRSSGGLLFGGVNFNHWISEEPYFSSSTLNFLFALTDGHHREDLQIFRGHSQYLSFNHSKYGPSFRSYNQWDLVIYDFADLNPYSFFSNLPSCFDGNGASYSALASSGYFGVSDYEVFAISK